MSALGSDRNARLLEVGLALSSELSLSAVLQRIIDLAVEVTAARYGALGVLGPDERISEFVTTGITEEQRRAIGDLPVGHGILGVLIGDAKPLRLRSIADHPQSVGFPPNHPPMRSFLGAPLKARGRVFGNIYLTEKQGAPEFSEQDEDALVILAAQAGVAVENARLYEEARQRERRLEAIREISTRILEGADPEDILELVALRARELVGADLATIAVPADQRESLRIQVADGMYSDELRGMEFPMEPSVSGEPIHTGNPVVLSDASGDERAYQPMIRLGEMGPAMFLPLSVRGNPFGTLAVANRTGGRTFSQEDLAVVETFAGQASVAIEYGRVQSELKRLTVMDERERIAKELHDGVIQSLFAVGMGLQATATLSKDPALEQRISDAVGEIDRAIRDLRNYIFGLRPGVLADRQLDQAIRQLAEDFQGKTGVTTAVEIDGRVAAEVSGRAGDVIQLIREALSNIGRHANAATCRVSLIRTKEGALLEIDDDGQGFDSEAAKGKGHGLRNLEERANSIGGELEIASAKSDGTTIRVRIPL
jgi:two-component system, NarL family, sensor histidine kinase DevS